MTYLRWSDVDPARHPFHADRVEATVERALQQALLDIGTRRADATEREHAVDRALIAEHGPWIAGWRWARSEPGCGGPVAAYCCALDSLTGDIPKDTATIIAAATDWRGRLETLSRRFEELREATSSLDAPTTASHAATQLLPLILEWTGAEDAWYSTFEVVLSWFLELELGEAERAAAIAREALSGRFQSWITPEESQRDEACAAVAEAADRLLQSTAPDGLAAWITQRSQVSWRGERVHRPGLVEQDGHERYIEDVDARRDPMRAHRMRQALVLARTHAFESRPLTVDLLSEWQEAVLGDRVAFRTTEAFAHGGAERYGISPETCHQFETYLAEANDASVSPISCAARAYLDVCYFHPFPDGNARAARLALDYVLTAHGLALHAAGPVFLVARRALDPHGPHAFIHILDYLAGPRRT